MMQRLLKLEFSKLKRQKSFYICSVIMVALLWLSTALSYVVLKEFSDFSMSGILLMTTALSSCSFTTIAGIFVALFVCDDYEQQTIKNIYAKGFSRKHVYMAKLIAVYTAVTIMFLVVELSALILGRLYLSFSSSGSFRFLKILGVQYVVTMANMTLCYAIASVFRKNGSSIAAVVLAPGIISLVLSLIDTIWKIDPPMTRIWISNFLSDISTLSVSNNRLTTCLIASLIYIPLFSLVGWRSAKKAEV